MEIEEVNPIEVIERDSILFLGEIFGSRIYWAQYFDTKQDLNENEIRNLMLEAQSQVFHGRQEEGSARKFRDGKLLYFLDKEDNKTRIYCLFTRAERVPKSVKTAFKLVIDRGGVYSARRFFIEVLQLIDDPELRQQEENAAIRDISQIDFDNSIDANLIGKILRLIKKSHQVTPNLLDQIHLWAYETLQQLEIQGVGHDNDIALDGIYKVAQTYNSQEVFHLGLELFKRILPLALNNERFDLYLTAQIEIAAIYYRHFPEFGHLVINLLTNENVRKEMFTEISPTDKQKYFTLLGESYLYTGDFNNAKENFISATKVSGDILDPSWNAVAHSFLGRDAESEFQLSDAVQHYLTAASLSFSAGDIGTSTENKDRAGKCLILQAEWETKAAMIARMDSNRDKSSYLGWHSLKLLIEGFLHLNTPSRSKILPIVSEVLEYSRYLLDIPGYKRRNFAFIRKAEKTIFGFMNKQQDLSLEINSLNRLLNEINKNIPIAPPTILVITPDGRLILSGTFRRTGWSPTDLQDVIFSGVLSAIMAVISEVSHDTSVLRTIDAGDTKIILEPSETVVLVFLMDREIREIRPLLRSLTKEIEERFSDQLKFWDGNQMISEELKNIISKRVVHLIR